MTDAPAFDREAVRAAILKAALVHVPFEGWTGEVLRRGATDAGFPPETALRVFPRGPVQAIETWCRIADQIMLDGLATPDLAARKVRERVALAVRLRLEPLAFHREAVRRALGLLALPHNAGVAAATLWRTVDAIWYAAGDTSTDFNFYTKRGLLAGVYSATLLYWLDDRSEDSVETWRFLDRRLADVMRIPQALGSLGRRLADFPNPLRWLRPPPIVRR